MHFRLQLYHQLPVTVTTSKLHFGISYSVGTFDHTSVIDILSPLLFFSQRLTSADTGKSYCEWLSRDKCLMIKQSPHKSRPAHINRISIISGETQCSKILTTCGLLRPRHVNIQAENIDLIVIGGFDGMSVFKECSNFFCFLPSPSFFMDLSAMVHCEQLWSTLRVSMALCEHQKLPLPSGRITDEVHFWKYC